MEQKLAELQSRCIDLQLTNNTLTGIMSQLCSDSKELCCLALSIASDSYQQYCQYQQNNNTNIALPAVTQADIDEAEDQPIDLTTDEQLPTSSTLASSSDLDEWSSFSSPVSTSLKEKSSSDLSSLLDFGPIVEEESQQPPQQPQQHGPLLETKQEIIISDEVTVKSTTEPVSLHISTLERKKNQLAVILLPLKTICLNNNNDRQVLVGYLFKRRKNKFPYIIRNLLKQWKQARHIATYTYRNDLNLRVIDYVKFFNTRYASENQLSLMLTRKNNFISLECTSREVPSTEQRPCRNIPTSDMVTTLLSSISLCLKQYDSSFDVTVYW